jgi:hypothetical protein
MLGPCRSRWTPGWHRSERSPIRRAPERQATRSITSRPPSQTASTAYDGRGSSRPRAAPHRRAARARRTVELRAPPLRCGLWVPSSPFCHTRWRTRRHAHPCRGHGIGHRAFPSREQSRMTSTSTCSISRAVFSAHRRSRWESALKRGIVRSDVLDRVQWRATAARELAAVAGSLSDSGIETAFAPHAPRRCDRAPASLGRRAPTDGVIGERLGVQVDGLAFHQADRRRDLRADAPCAARVHDPAVRLPPGAVRSRLRPTPF